MEPSKLIKKVIAKYYKSYNRYYEDLYQSGYVGYLTAMKRFDPDKEGGYTYLVLHIRKAISECLKTLNKPEEEIEDIPDDETRNIHTEDVHYALKSLDGIERYVIEQMYIIEGSTQKELAKELNVSQQRISQIWRRALKKITNNLAKS